MRRSISFFLLSLIGSFLFSILLAVPLSAQSTGLPGDDSASPFAQTLEEREQLLEKAEKTLLWFRGLGRETRAGIPPTGYRKMISPMELMQAAAIMKEQGKVDMSRMLREMFGFFQATPEECFEIEERLGSERLTSFKEEKELLGGEIEVDSTTLIQQGAAEFLRNSLRASEKMALINDPKTPSEIMEAVDLLAVSGRPMLTRFYLRRFLDAELTPRECAEIADRIGARRLTQIATNPALTPQGEAVVSKLYAEAQKHWGNAETVSQAFDTWQEMAGKKDDARPESQESLRAFWRGRQISAERLLDELKRCDNRDEADEMLAVLLSLKGDIKEALAESLRSDNTRFLESIVRGLSVSTSYRDSFLFYPLLFSHSDAVSKELRELVRRIVKEKDGRIPTRDEAVATLYTRATDYFEHRRPLQSDEEGVVRLWNWNEEKDGVESLRIQLPDAYRLLAFRYASQAERIVDPEGDNRKQVRLLYLTTLFEKSATQNGLDTPLDTNSDTELSEALKGSDRRLLETILLDAIEKEYDGAALVAVAALKTKGDAKQLLDSGNGKPRPLVLAAAAPSRRVQFAALETIMSLKPETPFAGSSLVAESLVWFSHAEGRPVIVSAHPKQSVAAKTAGHFIACGYQGEVAMTGRDALRQAADSPDVEMMVIDLRCREPSVPNLVQQMRTDRRTHDIPIAVLTDDGKALDAAESQASLSPRPAMEKIERLDPDNPFGFSIALIYPPVRDDRWAQWIRDDLFEKTGVRTVPGKIRLEQARQALRWLKEILESARKGTGPKIYHFEELEDTVRRALMSDVRIVQGLELASVIKSGTMQDAIYAVASNDLQPMELRRKAAECFKQSLDTYGILLRGAQVRNLYDQYNASEFKPVETQQLLGSMIDLIEEITFADKKND